MTKATDVAGGRGLSQRVQEGSAVAGSRGFVDPKVVLIYSFWHFVPTLPCVKASRPSTSEIQTEGDSLTAPMVSVGL